ncbi:MAG: hypothetical protein COU27_01750 [Candidatus Levybacteria bacterium CG10_big_fil_rev_8_21_14_0_10_36_7]|nr:MAG: hypothetical protein COU27_01750 [Candidatus Levybacteria bacterium CG10_big_fil_rev_8_21_14_0_10_36_7]
MKKNKTAIKRSTNAQKLSKRNRNSFFLNNKKLFPFIIGITTLLVLALILYKYSVNNNYKVKVLGAQIEYLK